MPKRNYIKHGICASIWFIFLPIRIAMALALTTLLTITLPFWFLLELRVWACADQNFDWEYMENYVKLWFWLVIEDDWSFFR